MVRGMAKLMSVEHAAAAGLEIAGKDVVYGHPKRNAPDLLAECGPRTVSQLVAETGPPQGRYGLGMDQLKGFR